MEAGAASHTDTNEKRSMWKQLQKGIAEFYDESSSLWEKIWGDHMHHGFYNPNASDVSLSDHRAAQIRMIEEALKFASINSGLLRLLIMHYV